MKTLLLRQADIYRGDLVLVNSACGLRPMGGPLIPVLPGSDVLLRREAAEALHRLMEAIGGWRHIVPVSGWRSHTQQRAIWDSSMAENGPAFTETYVARPGHSEHETGLAIDLGLNKGEIDFLRPDFPYEGICQAFREAAPVYGFIQRYPAGRESVTGIGHEPWHFRYVGRPHGEIMAALGLTLEEYIGFLRRFPHGQSRACRFGSAAVSYIMAGDKPRTALALEDGPYCLSGNNVDGWILTQWRAEP